MSFMNCNLGQVNRRSLLSLEQSEGAGIIVCWVSEYKGAFVKRLYTHWE